MPKVTWIFWECGLSSFGYDCFAKQVVITSHILKLHEYFGNSSIRNRNPALVLKQYTSENVVYFGPFALKRNI